MFDIYLATPYSHPNKGVMQSRYVAITHLSVDLALSGYSVYSPITHWHEAANWRDLDTNFQFWKKQCLDAVAACHVLVVHCIDGWEDSKGVSAEVKEAERLGKPIVYFSPDAALEFSKKLQEALSIR